MNVTVAPVSSFKQLSISMRKFKSIGRSILIFSGTILFLAGFLKLINVGAEEMIEGLENANLLKYRIPISILSVFCGILLVVPKLSTIGILFATAYWGGAIVAHLTYDDSFLMPAVFLGIIWVGAYCLYGFNPRSSSANQEKLDSDTS